MPKKYRVRLRKAYRNQFTGEIVGALPVKSFETTADTPEKAESNARYRFGADGLRRKWHSVGYGEQMRVELVECREIA